ncbi:hydrolase, haloacid dehalogenase-like family protein [Streptococcus ictaluri 707-05]|uniref:Hydrolase, haloacid dehalogenase-like family protein n=1 Tax=Streptococcus ictaluri 707-05 TaxID=764299 RepID=G5K0B0_9STRE|nr:hydrolase, haloacid dehalogenase-like family protein [Streptococcus ictaluri 707-05]
MIKGIIFDMDGVFAIKDKQYGIDQSQADHIIDHLEDLCQLIKV